MGVPTPFEILSARENLGLTREEAGAVIYKDPSMWGKWEKGLFPMSRANWELFMLKMGMAKMVAGRPVAKVPQH